MIIQQTQTSRLERFIISGAVVIATSYAKALSQYRELVVR